jgi:hypothetical protein
MMVMVVMVLNRKRIEWLRLERGSTAAISATRKLQRIHRVHIQRMEVAAWSLHTRGSI